MNAPSRNISGHPGRPVIRQLDEAAINRIAAGEVVERPASAVKELAENAIDAGARRVNIEISGGGKHLIRVSDDGCGMTPEDLPLALCRHATSKIDGSDLLEIRSFGFRGEALPSLGAVGRLTITSRAEGADACRLRCHGGRMEPVEPAALSSGTVVELRDLFYATPARLKFLRTDRAETQAIAEVVRRLALAEPFVTVTLTDITEDGARRELFRADAAQGELWDAMDLRVRGVLGREFADNALKVDVQREGMTLAGHAGLPTYSRGAATQQFVFVNGRPVRDRLLLGALSAAYHDTLPRGRYPAAVLFLGCEPARVDVNVHPAKAEVRFRDPQAARGLIVSGLRQALAEAGHRASSTVGSETLRAFSSEGAAPRIYQMDLASRPSRTSVQAALAWSAPGREGAAEGFGEAPRTETPGFAEAPAARVEAGDGGDTARPLGAARAQLHGCYIVAQTETGMVIVDQHAAHERLVYETLKRQAEAREVRSQALLLPEIVDLGAALAALVAGAAEALDRLGLSVEPFGGGAVAVRAVPAILGQPDVQALVRDLADALDESGGLDDSEAEGVVRGRLDAILSRMACHGSVRSGRQMRAEEMNALLRQMEATPLSGQCNHGRPTYVELKLSDIERLFGRS